MTMTRVLQVSLLALGALGCGDQEASSPAAPRTARFEAAPAGNEGSVLTLADQADPVAEDASSQTTTKATFDAASLARSVAARVEMEGRQ